MSDTMIP